MNRMLMIAMILLSALAVSCVDTDNVPKGPDDGRSAESETIQLLVPRRRMDRGEKIEAADLKVVLVETYVREGLGEGFIASVYPTELTGEVLARSVERGRFLRWDDFVAYEVSRGPKVLAPNTEAFVLRIEPGASPGQLLRLGDRVVVIGVLLLEGKAPRAYRIIEGVRVVAIDGKTTFDIRGSDLTTGENAAIRNYSRIAIQVDAETAIQLHNVITHAVGPLRINVLRPKHMDTKYMAAKYVDPIPINPELADIEPAVPTPDDPARGDQ